MKIITGSNKHKDHFGQALVELALTLPIFLLLLYGVFEVGRWVYMSSAVLNASRDAARYAEGSGDNSDGVEYYRDCAGIRNRASSVSSFVPVTTSIAYDHGPDESGNSDPFATCESLPASTKFTHGDRVVITVTSTFNPIVPITNFESIPITSTVARTLVIDLNIYDPY